MRIGIIGGTGPAGQGLALRLAAAGVGVVLGSRSSERSASICQELQATWEAKGVTLTPGDNAAAAACELVVLATPWDGAVATVTELTDQLAGKVVVSMANALTRFGREWSPLLPPRGSVAATIQAVLPKAMVAAAFQHLPAKPLADLDRPLDLDVMVCSDHREATEATMDLVNRIPGMRPVDCGGLGSALAIEALTPVLIAINVRYKTHASVRVTGLEGKA